MIDAGLRHAYATDGVVCLRAAFDAEWLAVAADAIEQGRANPGPMHVDYSAETKPGTYCGDFWIWRQVPAMRTFIFESPAARIAGELMDVPSVMLVTDNWLIREAGAVNKAPWHHDAPYFDLDGKWCVLWMALEPVGPGEGIVVLKGSHRWGRTFMPESFAGTGPKAEVQGPYERTPDFARELQRHAPVEYTWSRVTASCSTRSPCMGCRVIGRRPAPAGASPCDSPKATPSTAGAGPGRSR